MDVKELIALLNKALPAAVLIEAEDLLQDAEVLIVAGTSCQVAPASYLPSQVHLQGGSVIEINREPVLDGLSDITLATDFTKAMKGILTALHI